MLGEHQDSVTVRRRRSELGVLATPRRENTFTMGRLYALEQAKAALVEAHFDQACPTFTRK